MDVKVISFSSCQNSEFVTNFVVLVADGWILDRNKFETEETSLTVEAALKETVSWGWVRGFKVHPRYTVGSNIFYDFPNVDDYVAL